MMSTGSRVVLASAAVVLCTRLPAEAANLNWNNAAGGAAATAGNWLPAQVPGGADDLTFNLNNVYTVSYNATVQASDTHTYRQGTVTLNLSSPHTVAGGITIGDLSGDTATATLTTGVWTSNASVVIGDASGSAGTLNVNDDDAEFIVSNGADLTVGLNGAATLSITAAGTVEVADQFIAGSNASSAPIINISGFSLAPFGTSNLDVLGTGESRVGQGGDASMTITSGAFASFAGDLIIANGSASTSSISVHTVGLLPARLLVDGDLLIGRNSSATAAGNGTLIVDTGGEADVAGETKLGDPNGGVGILDLGGGVFDGGLGVTVLAGSTIIGNGTINADVANSGNILPSGGTGLTFNGLLSNTTNTILGNKIHFGADGGYNGSGTCQADITGHVASTITATGPLTIGANTASGFSYLGTLNVGSQSVTLSDSNGAVLGGQTHIDNGTLSCANGIGIQNGAAIRGRGTLSANVVNAGILEPTDPGDAPVDIDINGTLLLNPTSKIEIELNGPGNSDRINVSGPITLNGTVEATLAPDYLPSFQEQMILINSMTPNGLSGTTFSSINHTPICDQYRIVLVYSQTAGIALIRPNVAVTSPGDVDQDGDHDLDDFAEWLPCLAGPDNLVPPPGCDPDDFHFRADLDMPYCEDYDVDLKDFSVLQRILDD